MQRLKIPTEIGQQVIERAQAGLSLTSDEAISEYIDAGVAAGMIGSTVGGVGNIRAARPEKTDPTDGIQGELFGDDVDLGIKPGQRELFDDDVDLGIKPITVPTKDKDQAEFDFEGTEKSTAEPSVTKETETGATQTEFDFEDRPITASPDTALSAAMKKAVGDVKQEKQFNEAELALARQKTLEKIQAEETKREDAKKTEDLSPPPEVEREEVQDSLFGLGRKYEEKQRQASIDAQKPISVPNTITTELLDKLGIRASAPIRKRIIDKDLSDPAVRQELIKHANNRGVAQQTKLNISNYLRGTPEEQGDLFPPRRRKKDAGTRGADATRSRAGVQNVVPKTDDKDAKEPDAPEEARVDSPEPSVRPAVDTEVIGDDTLEVTPKKGETAVDFLARKREAEKTKTPVEEEPIFKDETVTSLEGITKRKVMPVLTGEGPAVAPKDVVPTLDAPKSGQVFTTAKKTTTTPIKVAEEQARYRKAVKPINAELKATRAQIKKLESKKTLNSKDEGKLTALKDRRRALNTQRTKLLENKKFIEKQATAKTPAQQRRRTTTTEDDALDLQFREAQSEQASPSVRKFQSKNLTGFEFLGALSTSNKAIFSNQSPLTIEDKKKILKLINTPNKDLTLSEKNAKEYILKNPDPMVSIENMTSEVGQEMPIARDEVGSMSSKEQKAYYAKTGGSIAQDVNDWVEANLSDETNTWVNNEIEYYEISETNTAEMLADAELPENAVSNLDVPIHPSVKRALTKGDLKGALEGLAVTSTNKRIKRIAIALSKKVGTTKLEVVKTLDTAGVFDPKTNTIKLNATTGLNTHTLLHEMTHAAVSANLRNKSHPTTVQLNKLFKSVKGLLNTAYGSTNLDEFVSEAMSNPEFQKTLASIHVQGEPISALRRFINIVANFGRRLVGVPPVALTYIPNMNSSLQGLDLANMVETLVQGNDMFDAILAPAPEYRNADMLPLNATAGGVKALMGSLSGIQKQINKYPKVQNFADEFVGIMTDVPDKIKKVILGLVGSQGIGDIAKKVGLRNLGYDLNTIMHLQRGAVQASDRAVGEVQQEFAAWNNKYPKLKEALDKLIYSRVYGSTVYQVDPLLSRVAAEKRYGKDSEKMNIWDMQQGELNKLSPSERTLLLNQYTKLRDTYKKMYIKLQTVLFKRIDDALENDVEAATKLKNTVYSKIFEANTLDVYFPLVREGNFKLTYSYKNVNKAPEEEVDPSYVIRMFSTKMERNRVAKEIRADDKFENVKTSDGDFDIKHFDNAPSFSFVGRTLDTLKAKKVDPDIQREIVQLFIDALPETSFAKSLQKRKGFEGHIDSAIDAFSTKAYDLGRQIVRLDYSARIQKVLNEIANATPDPAAMKAKSFTGKGTEALTASFDSVQKELLERGQFARNPPSEPLTKKANQFAFIYTIGFNVSSAIVNLSQVPLFVMPYLGARYGLKETATDITTAGKLVTAARNNVLEFYDVNEQGDYTVKSSLDLPPNLKKEFQLIAPIVKMGAERGLLTTSFLQNTLGLDESGRKRSFGDSVSTWSAFFFNHGERFNRQTTLLASYKLELARLEGKIKTRTAAEAKMTSSERQLAAANSAVYQTQETNGGAVLETAPRLTQKGLGRIAFMYKSYGLQMYYTMLKSAVTMMDSDMSNAEQRKIAAKQLSRCSWHSVILCRCSWCTALRCV